MNFVGYGFTFPFPIICLSNVSEWPIITRKASGLKILIYPPFLSGDNSRLTNDFDINESPSFKMRNISVDAATSLPKGFRTLPQCFGQNGNFRPPQQETNAFQIEIETKEETKADKAKSWLIKSALRQLRRRSGQFWIEHPAIYFEGYQRAQYLVKDGKLHHDMWSHSTVYSGTLRQQVIDFATWEQSWKTAEEHFDTDAFDSLHLAEHQSAGGFLFEACISCALSIEKAKYELWQKLYDRGHCAPSDLKAAKNDTAKPERYFAGLLPDQAISFSVEEIAAIQDAWKVRGLVAHGNETHIERLLGKPLARETLTKWTNMLWSVALKVSEY